MFESALMVRERKAQQTRFPAQLGTQFRRIEIEFILDCDKVHKVRLVEVTGSDRSGLVPIVADSLK